MRIISRLNVGGPAVHCILLSKRLREHGFETMLVTGSPGPGEADFEQLYQVKAEGFELKKLKRLQRALSALGDLRTLVELILLVHREKPDIVHTHTAKAGVLGRIAAAVNGVPIVLHTFHGHVLHGYFSERFSKFVAWVERVLARKSSALITLSPGLRDELSNRFHVAEASRFRVIPLGRDLHPFFAAPGLRGTLRRELGIAPGTSVFGIVGRLVPIKNHELLLRACADLPKDQPWALVIAGEGPLLDVLQGLAADLGIEKRVHFLGWRSDLPTIYADLDFSIISSRNEGTPLSIIESFAASCPVVATKVGGISDMFGESTSGPDRLDLRPEGVLLESDDRAALTAGLAYLMTNPPAREACASAARSKAEQFSDHALAERMAGLYRELLAGTRRALEPGL